MASNLFIAYDLMKPGQNYDQIRDAIKDLGQWHQFQFSLFYVHTSLNAHDAYNRIARFMDSTDKLAVIDAKEGVVSNWDEPPIDAINAIWHSPEFEARGISVTNERPGGHRGSCHLISV
jgi:hypothetical protein